MKKSPYKNKKYKSNTSWTDVEENTLVFLYKHKNYDLAEIAEELGRSQGAARKRLQHLDEWRGAPNSPKEKLRRMINVKNMSKEEYAYFKDMETKPRWNMEDTVNLCTMVYKYPAEITKMENYSKVARVR